MSEAEAAWAADLTPKQAQFVREYLIDLNSTQAAIRAGYSPKTAHNIGSENIRKPEVAFAINAAMAERSKRTGITADRVLAELAKIGLADIRNVMRWGDAIPVTDPDTGEERLMQGVALIASADLDADAAAAISEVSQGKDGSLKVKLHDKRAALTEIGKHLGIAQTHELSGRGGGPIETRDVSNSDLAKVLLSIIAGATDDTEASLRSIPGEG